MVDYVIDKYVVTNDDLRTSHYRKYEFWVNPKQYYYISAEEISTYNLDKGLTT